MDATGQKALQLAFVLAPSGGGCSPTTKLTAEFAAATPPVTSPAAPPTPPPAGSCSDAVWVAATACTAGAVVDHGSHRWTAKWWTRGDVLGNNGQDVWTDDGSS